MKKGREERGREISCVHANEFEKLRSESSFIIDLAPEGSITYKRVDCGRTHDSEEIRNIKN